MWSSLNKCTAAQCKYKGWSARLLPQIFGIPSTWPFTVHQRHRGFLCLAEVKRQGRWGVLPPQPDVSQKMQQFVTISVGLAGVFERRCTKSCVWERAEPWYKSRSHFSPILTWSCPGLTFSSSRVGTCISVMGYCHALKIHFCCPERLKIPFGLLLRL